MKNSFIILVIIISVVLMIAITTLILNPSKEYLVTLDYKYVENNNCYIIVKRVDNGEYERIKTTISQYQDINDYQILYNISTQGVEQKILYKYELQIFE